LSFTLKKNLQKKVFLHLYISAIKQ